jgi:hypothetical protein
MNQKLRRISEGRPTVQDGMVFLKDRKKEMNIEDVHSPLEMLLYFEWFGKLSLITGKGPVMLLSNCPVCSGLDPGDSNAALPELVEVYKRSSGHKPDCKLDAIIRSMRECPINSLSIDPQQATLGIYEQRD